MTPMWSMNSLPSLLPKFPVRVAGAVVLAWIVGTGRMRRILRPDL